ncbi:uncharacterized protein SCHCODRAFT_02569405 [Schizophyllum commune H4-8]|nr:uncharacterized protein SCHCODRAFT_02569405 [Schizophyllum commune H4-8]KAI5896619.1 hypothetical protein SCHCODRAFT_02569405 [Schizophyllum commune H4-8]
MLYVHATYLGASTRSSPSSSCTFSPLWRFGAAFPDRSRPSPMDMRMGVMTLKLVNATPPRTSAGQDRTRPFLLSQHIDLKIIKHHRQGPQALSKLSSRPSSTGALSHLVGKAQ